MTENMIEFVSYSNENNNPIITVRHLKSKKTYNMYVYLENEKRINKTIDRIRKHEYKVDICTHEKHNFKIYISFLQDGCTTYQEGHTMYESIETTFMSELDLERNDLTFDELKNAIIYLKKEMKKLLKIIKRYSNFYLNTTLVHTIIDVKVIKKYIQKDYSRFKIDFKNKEFTINELKNIIIDLRNECSQMFRLVEDCRLDEWDAY